MSKKNKYSINDLIYEKDYQIEVQSEIKNLQGLQKNIYNFLKILDENRELNFIDLQKHKTNELYKVILIGLNANSKDINSNSKNNLELNYFLELLNYFSKQNNIGKLSNFEELKLNLLPKLDVKDSEKIKFYSLLDYKVKNKEIFYKILNSELFKIIQPIIDNLESELIVDEQEYKLSDLIISDIEKNKDNTKKVLEIPHKNYPKYFEEIFNILYKNRNEDIIDNILVQNNLIDKCKDLFDFVSINKEEISRLENGKIIYNFVIGIFEESFTENFNEHIKEQNINSIDLLSITRYFLEIYEEINNMS
ncbi:MAG: hypothetical protein Q9M94_01375 [Candidatus Gracilibacteria bacterium]|nr:hypothetical protein [Candidatus Gracilibacteria bacterium]